MKVLYEDPKDFLYTRWSENGFVYDIWYKDVTNIYQDYKNEDLPKELIDFLDKWTKLILEYKEEYHELYPVKLAKIEFIYSDRVYRIFPSTIKATYLSNFMSDTEYEVEWDSLFETYQSKIRLDLKKELGVVHSRYFGFLD